jgi:ribonuclease-3
VLGAMYVDSDLETVRRVVLQQVVTPELEHMARNGSTLPMTDYKSALQEKLQATGRPQASYVLVKVLGPEHNKTFTVEVRLQAIGNHNETEFVGRAEGSTKKNAEQGAAQQVLEHLASLSGVSASKVTGKGRP